MFSSPHTTGTCQMVMRSSVNNFNKTQQSIAHKKLEAITGRAKLQQHYTQHDVIPMSE